MKLVSLACNLLISFLVQIHIIRTCPSAFQIDFVLLGVWAILFYGCIGLFTGKQSRLPVCVVQHGLDCLVQLISCETGVNINLLTACCLDLVFVFFSCPDLGSISLAFDLEYIVYLPDNEGLLHLVGQVVSCLSSALCCFCSHIGFCIAPGLVKISCYDTKVNCIPQN